MAILKCKICGGDMEVSPDKTFGTCEYCGTSMTLPKIDDNARAAAFNRGNHFRRAGEFDKALQVYEKIVEEDPNDAEARWCCALCRFGIEWVEDPATTEYLPTCHRASFDPFTEDVDCKAAIELSDGITKKQYQRDAAKIAEVQKGILATSQNEEPFDVFICYKESDENGKRTVDSTLAQDVYYQLTDQGLRVFFARITLEDKTGSEYEPYIFAALNSAKVMVVIGTKPEHFNAVWVKNEWARYLSIVKRDRSKAILPCYRDMDPYDLPEQLSILQSYDMAKIGFIQDLIRGIKKIVSADAPQLVKETVVVNAAAANTAPLLKRAFMFLEDGDWQQADEYCEKVLDQDPENAQAYLGKLMAELRVRKQESLADCAQPFDGRNNYQKALRFGDEKFITTIKGYITHINERNENAWLTQLYNKAYSAMQAADSEERYLSAAQEFKAISGFRNADALVKQCTEKAEACRVERLTGLYDQAVSAMQKAAREDEFMSAAAAFQNLSGFRDADALAQKCLDSAQDSVYSSAKAFLAEDTVDGCEMAEHFFSRIPGWKDADEQLQISRKRIDELKAKEEAERIAREQKKKEAQLALIRKLEEEKAERERKEKEARALAAKKRKKILAIVAVIAAVCIAAAVLLIYVIIPNSKYSDAVKLNEEGKYREALAAFTALEGYKDSAERAAALWTENPVRQTLAADSQHTVGLKADGTVVAVGENGDGQCDVSGWSDIVAISAGHYHTVGLKADGTVVAVGINENGRCDVSGWTDIVAIAAGGCFTVGLKADGTVVAAGSNYSGQCDVSGWTDIVAIAAGYWHTVGLKADGTAVAVGWNYAGQCDVSGWTDIVAIAAGYWHTVGLKADGTLVAVGRNEDGQCDVSGWTDIVAIAAGYAHTVGLKADGTAVAVGENDDGQCDVAGWTDIVAIAAGDSQTVGLKADGTAVAVGWNEDGQCDVEDWSDIRLPSREREQ